MYRSEIPPTDEAALFVDLYELTMAQSYFEQDMSSNATFSLFTRKSEINRSYFVSAGMADVLRYLQELSFSQLVVDYLRSTGLFKDSFLQYLSRLRFTGEVRGIPEGRLYFADEPLLEITAPIIEAQLIETMVINQMNMQSMIATKAARCYLAAGQSGLIDFSMRRAHGTDAGLKAARCSYMVGFQATSNVLAGRVYGIPLAGTMAHSYVASFESEIEAFRAYVTAFPVDSVLLIDTYDTISATGKAIEVAIEMEKKGQFLKGVRIDSGDILYLSEKVRRLLDDSNLGYVKIIASGGLDENKIGELVKAGARIDMFGVGTQMATSGDVPWLEMAYKIVNYAGRPILKLSPGKISLPGGKQAFRIRNTDGTFNRDVISLADEFPPESDSEPLLETFMEAGRVVRQIPLLEDARKNFRQDIESLEGRFKLLSSPLEYPVELSDKLLELQKSLEKDIRQRNAE